MPRRVGWRDQLVETTLPKLYAMFHATRSPSMPTYVPAREEPMDYASRLRITHATSLRDVACSSRAKSICPMWPGKLCPRRNSNSMRSLLSLANACLMQCATEVNNKSKGPAGRCVWRQSRAQLRYDPSATLSRPPPRGFTRLHEPWGPD